MEQDQAMGASRYGLKSDVWKHMTRLGQDEAQCKKCFRKIQNKGNTTNLWNHLKTHGIAKTSREKSREIVNSDEEGNHPDNPEEIVGSSSQSNEGASASGNGRTSSVSLRSPSEARQSRKRTATSSPFSQPTLESTLNRSKSYEVGGSRAAALDDALLFMVCKDHMPLCTPENDGFLHFCEVAVPLWKPPSRTTLTRYLETKYDVLKGVLVSHLETLPSVTLTFDVWTETHTTTSFLGGSLHYSNGVNLETCTLSVTELTQAHTGEYLASVIRKVLSDWSIKVSQVFLCVTDNAANILCAVREVFGADHCVPCFDHTLNLIPKYALGVDPKNNQDYVPGVPAFVKKVKDIVTFFHSSTKASDLLKQLQKENGRTQGTCLRLIQSVDTRWSSSFDMLVRFLEMADIIGVVLLKFPDKVMLTGAELAQIRIVADLLQPFAQITAEMSADKTTTASKVIPLIHLLRQRISMVEPPPADVLMTRLKKFLISEIDRRFKEIDKHRVFALATMLDPRFKQMHFSIIGHANANSLLSEKVRGLIRNENLAEANKEPVVQPPSRPDNIWSVHDNMVASQQVNRDDSELDSGRNVVELRQYLNRPVVERSANPLAVWENIKGQYPHLYILAKQYLSLVGTSVPSERLFSDAKMTMSALRSRLTPIHLHQLLFLSSVDKKFWKSISVGST